MGLDNFSNEGATETSSDSVFPGEAPAQCWGLADEEIRIPSIADLMSRVAELESRLASAEAVEGRDIDEAILSGYRGMLDARVAAFDSALQDALPRFQEQLEQELAKKNDMQRQAHAEGLFVEGLGYPPHQMRVISCRLNIRTVTYSVFPTTNHQERTEVLGAISPTGRELSAAQWRSEQGIVESDGLGLIDWVLTAWAAIGLLRGFVRLSLRFVSTRASRLKVPLRRQWFAQPGFQSTPYLRAGAGQCDEYGNITISSLGTPADQRLAFAHEYLHSLLSPKFLPFRDLRAKVKIVGYKKSQLLRYTEEALAETFAQMKINGVSASALVEGLRFPMGSAVYQLTWKGVAAEGVAAVTVGTIVVGGAAVSVQWILDAEERKARKAQKSPGPRHGDGRPVRD